MFRRSIVVPLLVVGVLSIGAPTHARAEPDTTIAVLLSLGSTLIPIGVTTGLWLGGDGPDDDTRLGAGLALLGTGTIVGPSVGAFYAGAGDEAILTLLLRGITGGIMLTGMGLAFDGKDDGLRDMGRALAAVGAVPTGLLGIYDFWTLPDKVKRASRRSRTVAGRPPLEVGPFSLCSSLRAGAFSCGVRL